MACPQTTHPRHQPAHPDRLRRRKQWREPADLSGKSCCRQQWHHCSWGRYRRRFPFGLQQLRRRIDGSLPSDDGEVFNRHQLRLDRLSPFAAQHDYSAFRTREYYYSHFSLLTTDLPGIFGYNQGSDPWSAIVPFGTNPGIGGGYYTPSGHIRRVGAGGWAMRPDTAGLQKPPQSR